LINSSNLLCQSAEQKPTTRLRQGCLLEKSRNKKTWCVARDNETESTGSSWPILAVQGGKLYCRVCCTNDKCRVVQVWCDAELQNNTAYQKCAEKKLLVHREESNYCSVLRIRIFARDSACGHRITQGQQDLGFTYVLCAVLTNSPNSCPPEEGEEWVSGFWGWYLYEIPLWIHSAILLRHGFRNRLKCTLLQSNRHGFFEID
jgi:hypothetical protein